MPPLRELFARTPEARMRGFTPSHFSFNGTRGRCPACEGRGATLVENAVPRGPLADLRGVRGPALRPRDPRGALPRRRSVADVLDMSVDEAEEFLSAQPKLVEVLTALSDVGLGYMKLGQSSTTPLGGRGPAREARERAPAARESPARAS